MTFAVAAGLSACAGQTAEQEGEAPLLLAAADPDADADAEQAVSFTDWPPGPKEEWVFVPLSDQNADLLIGTWIGKWRIFTPAGVDYGGGTLTFRRTDGGLMASCQWSGTSGNSASNRSAGLAGDKVQYACGDSLASAALYEEPPELLHLISRLDAPKWDAQGKAAFSRQIIEVSVPQAELIELPGPYIVYFPFDKTILTAEARQTLDAAARAWGAVDDKQTARLAVRGHADRSAPRSYNVGLSLVRSQVVAAYLADRGVPRNKIRIAFFGETDPAVPTEDGQREQLNRRAEITFEICDGPC